MLRLLFDVRGDLTAGEYAKELGPSKEMEAETEYLIQLLSQSGTENTGHLNSNTGHEAPLKTIEAPKEGFSIRPNLDGKGIKPNSTSLEIDKGKSSTTIVTEKDFFKTEDQDKYLILRSGTSETLSNLVAHSVIQNSVPITEIKNVACITIESSRFSGYLIAAMGKDRQLDESFINAVQVRLLEFLRKKEKKVHERAALDLVIRKVAFEPWAEDCAKFLVKSVHHDEDVAMAFFPHSEINYTLAESASEEMAAISIEYLSEDSPTDFNVYMYMPVNDKYILYTPKGGRFYNSQRDRLKYKGVTHMHIQKTDIQEFGKYRVQSHLNSQIREHQERQAKRGIKKKTG